MISAGARVAAGGTGDFAAAGRLRVCHVMTADLWAGAEVQVAALASYLVTRPDVEVTAVLFNGGRLRRELDAIGVRSVVLDEERLGSVAILASLARVLKDQQPDIVHTHRYKDTVLAAVAARLAGVRHLVRTVHGLAEPMTGWDRVRFSAYDALDRLALRCSADRIVAVSHGIADALKAKGYRRAAVLTVHNGVDPSLMHPLRGREQTRTDIGVTAGALLIGTVGRLSAVKAQRHLLRAVPRILDSRPDARFAIVGDGPLREDLRSVAATLGITDRCLFLGARTDVVDLLAAMDIFVLPSLHEGIPMALLEAMALERPVVAAAVGGIPEVIRDGVDGLLFPSGDVAALAEACLQLARDPDQARTLGTRARQTVENAFSSHVNGERIMNIYRSSAAPCSPASRAVTRPRSCPAVPRLDAASCSAPRLAWELARALFAYAGQRTRDAVLVAMERRRLHRMRRDPYPLRSALGRATQILVVCQGNIIRSPFAARLIARAAASQAVTIASGGLAAIPGTPSPETACQVGAAYAVDLTGHAASALSTEAVEASDVIFVMDLFQLRAVRSAFPSAGAKTYLLTSLAPDVPLEIRDPYDGDEARFRACFSHIARAVQPIARTLAGTAPA